MKRTTLFLMFSLALSLAAFGAPDDSRGHNHGDGHPGGGFQSGGPGGDGHPDGGFQDGSHDRGFSDAASHGGQRGSHQHESSRPPMSEQVRAQPVPHVEQQSVNHRAPGVRQVQQAPVVVVGQPSHGTRTFVGGGRTYTYDARNFGRNNYQRFDRRSERFFNGRRAYFHRGFWFYRPDNRWPAWFYRCNVYFAMGRDGFWYAYCLDRPRLFIRVFIN